VPEPVRCTACGRPYNRLFTRCPFCNAPNAEAAPRPAARDAQPEPSSGSDYAAFAEQAIAVTRPFLPLEFHPAAVLALDHFFDQTWGPEGVAPEQEDWQPPEAKQRSILHLGAFFGELLRREFGGSWQRDPVHPANPLRSRLVLAGGIQLYPFSRVYKRMKNGASEPLDQLYRQARQMTRATGTAAELDGWVRYARHFEGRGREDLAATFYERALALPLAPEAHATLEAQRTAAVHAAAAREAEGSTGEATAAPEATRRSAGLPPPPITKPAPAPQPPATATALAEAVRALASRAAALTAQGRHGEALAELERLLELSPSNPEGLLGRATALIALGRPREALDELDELAARGDCEPRRTFLSATAADQLGEAVRAERSFRSIQEAPALSPDERAHCAERTAALAQHPAVLLEAIDGLPDTAAMMDAYARLSVARPELAAPLLERGVGLAMSGRTEEALACFDRAAALEPGEAKCYDHKAVTLLRLQRLDEVLRTLDEGLRHCPASGTLHCRRGIALATAGRNAEALAAFERSLEVDPAYAQAWAYKGDVEARLGDSTAAVVSLGRFLALRAGRPDKLVATVAQQRLRLQNPGRTRDEARAQACLGAGVAAHVAGRLEDARARFEEGVAADPLLSDLWLNLGAMQLELALTEEALASYRRAEELLGPSADVVRGQVACLRLLRRVDEALACHDRALERGRGNPDALLAKARTLVEIGRVEDALPLYRRLVARGPASLEYVSERAETLAKAGRTLEARFAYEAALALAPGDAGLLAKQARVTMELAPGAHPPASPRVRRTDEAQ
jgi:tetratricopeptide (TPR) repeat protein